MTRLVYLDSSSLLKTLWEEPESHAVREAIAREDHVVVSALSELEAEVQLRAKRLGGALTKRRYDAYRAALQSFRETAPFEFRDLPGTVFRRAIQQHLSSGTPHCRSLDRLHLAAMGELGLRCLMTNDTKQAGAARAIGYQVVFPAAAGERVDPDQLLAQARRLRARVKRVSQRDLDTWMSQGRP